MNIGDLVFLGFGGMFCFFGDSYRYFIYFIFIFFEKDVFDRELRVKKVRCDILSDLDDDNLS